MQTDSCNDALAHLKYDTLGLRREMHVLNLVKKCLNNSCPKFLKDYFYFNRDILQRRTRQSNYLRLPSVKLECTKKAFYYHGCVVFNRNVLDFYMLFLGYFPIRLVRTSLVLSIFNIFLYFYYSLSCLVLSDLGPLRISVFVTVRVTLAK